MKALLALALTAYTFAQAPVQSVPRPYEFKSYERYIYDYRELLSKKKARGRFELIILKKGKEYEVSIEGFYREWSGFVRTKVKDANELAGFILMKMYFLHHWLAPLGKTIFSRALVKVLSSGKVDWTPGGKRVDKDLLRLVRSCKYGGLEGVSLELLKKKELILKVCVSPQASLPIYIYRRTSGGDIYEIELIEYSDLK